MTFKSHKTSASMYGSKYVPYCTLVAWPLDYRFFYSPCLTALPVQYPVLDLYRNEMAKYLIILISYFCQSI